MNGEMMVQTGFIMGGSYLVGAIPFGLIIGKIFYKTDIREHGSKNPGATNVWRTLGRIPGITTLALDIVKGLVPVLIAKHFFPNYELIPIGAGLIAIIGHNWSIFIKGKGGKGVATSAGVFLGLTPLHMVFTIGGFLLFFLTTGHVSVGSMAAAVTLMSASLLIETSLTLRILILVAGLLILIKHIPNMRRLKRGEEHKVRFRSEK